MMLLDHVRCGLRAAVIYLAAALVGVAFAGEAGVSAPAGLPDVSPYAWPIASVLAAYLMKSGGPGITIRLVTEDGDAPSTKRPARRVAPPEP